MQSVNGTDFRSRLTLRSYRVNYLHSASPQPELNNGFSSVHNPISTCNNSWEKSLENSILENLRIADDGRFCRVKLLIIYMYYSNVGELIKIPFWSWGMGGMRVTWRGPSWCWGMSPSESLTFLETVGPRVINNVMVLQVNRIFEFFNDYLLTIVRLPCKR